MKTKYFYFFFLITFSIFSQSDYNYYGKQDKKNIYFNDFTDNSQNNYVGQTNFLGATIKNGNYTLENKTIGRYWIKFLTHQTNIKFKAPKLKINQSKDFEIEVSLKSEKYAIDSNVFSLIIGARWPNFNIIDQYYQLGFGPNSYVGVQKFYGGKYNNLTPWKKSNTYKNNGFNTLTYRKVGFQEYYYFNGDLIFSRKFTGFFGDNLGVAFSPKTILSVDYFRVSYLSEPDRIPPVITISSPDVSRGFKIVERNNIVTIKGNVYDNGGLSKVSINGLNVNFDASGSFIKNMNLTSTINQFSIVAIDKKGNRSTKTIEVQKQNTQQDIVNNLDLGGVEGKYYALIIGNNQYKDPAISSLDEPINDGQKLYDLLTTEYTFQKENTIFLKNASYVEMIEAFDNLSNSITENDNLLVFYAGHGWWDEKKNLGYWLPTDARKKNTAFWIANSRISDYMGSIKSRHTLLIADACFSGSIFKTRAAFKDAGQAIKSLHKLPSRSAMTSGNLKEVPDKSVFLQFLVKRLKENNQKYLTADQLFVSFRIAVMNNSISEPQFGTIRNSGDEGGEFIFIKKQ